MATTTGTEPEQLSTSQTLQAQINALTEFSTRLRSLRQLPPTLFHNVQLISAGNPTRRAMSELQSVRSMLLEEKLQTALKAAQESESRDRTGVHGGRRRETRKRKRSPTPESPKPYVAPKARTIFPSSVDGVPVQPLTVSALPEYVREFNRRHARKVAIHVWCRGGKGGGGTATDIVPPVVLRLTIPDVLKAFVTLDVPSEEDVDRKRQHIPVKERPLMVENVTVFGAREKQPPHSQSEYLVFQKMSQQIVRMVQAALRVPPQTLLDMLATYQTLFTDQCTVCERILSLEGYMPAIARVWREQEDSDVTHGMRNARDGPMGQPPESE